MKSRVYFIKVSDNDTKEQIKGKLTRLIRESRLFDFINKADKVAIKMHFGEEGNTGFVSPEYVRIAVDEIRKKQVEPVLTDTNTLYRGRRMTSSDHLELAHAHGFTPDVAGTHVLIADDKMDSIEIKGEFIKSAKVDSFFSSINTIVGIAHFKGHIMTGFGGALKNLGMGCASREGKLAQHSDIAPFVIIGNCTGCAACEKACPVKAITIVKEKSVINGKLCIGCASCIAACRFNAIDVDWAAGGNKIQEKMVEYTKAVMQGKNCAFLNFATKITAECDCLAKDDPKISPDVGIFASRDPVSLDQACYDLILKASGKDIFKEAHPKWDGLKQLRHAQEIGIGNLDYELITIE